MPNIKSFPNNQDEYIGAEDVMRWHHGRTSGVFGAEGNSTVSPVLDKMAVTVADGNGWLSDAKGNGIVWWIDNEAKTGNKLEVSVDIADAALPRVDRVVVSWQTTNYVALPEIIILKGTPASTPVAPTLTNDNMVRQISLARITIPAGATAIDASLITDERTNPNVCGIVTELVGVDTSGMHHQFQTFYNKTVAEQNAYIEAQKNSWEAFFADVQNDTVVPVPTVSDQGKVIKVNPTGDGYLLGDAQMEIPITSEVPEDSDIWIDPNEMGDGLEDYVVASGYYGGLTYRKWNSGNVELWGTVPMDEHQGDTHIFGNVALPFAVYHPIATMTLVGAELESTWQAPSTLSYRQFEGNNSTIRFSMFRTTGGLANVDFVNVAVDIKGEWTI